MSKPILCLDFDGVIHSYTSGWKGARVIPDDPVEGVISYMLTMLAEGFDVVVHSSRGQSFGGIWAMRRWLRKHAGNAWYECPMGPGLEDVRFARRKPSALITIDDRALTFNGDWSHPDYRAVTIRTFKPWNKRTVSP